MSGVDDVDRRQIINTVGVEQLSVAVGNGNITTVEVTDEFNGRLTTTLEIGSMTGGVVSSVTATLSVAWANKPPLSVTRKVNAAPTARQAAETFAVTFPAALTVMLETVTPVVVALDEPLTVTLKADSASSTSLTTAIDEFDAPAAC